MKTLAANSFCQSMAGRGWATARASLASARAQSAPTPPAPATARRVPRIAGAAEEGPARNSTTSKNIGGGATAAPAATVAATATDAPERRQSTTRAGSQLESFVTLAINTELKPALAEWRAAIGDELAAIRASTPAPTWHEQTAKALAAAKADAKRAAEDGVAVRAGVEALAERAIGPKLLKRVEEQREAVQGAVGKLQASAAETKVAIQRLQSEKRLTLKALQEAEGARIAELIAAAERERAAATAAAKELAASERRHAAAEATVAEQRAALAAAADATTAAGAAARSAVAEEAAAARAAAERVNDAHDDGDGRERRALDASRWDDLTRQQSALTKAHSQRLAALQLGAKAESPGYQERRMGELGVGA